jgi:hypothetical protein
MHLGDHIFFLPVVKVFTDSGYDVSICTTKPMHELFSRLNLPVIESGRCNLDNYELIISRFELIRHLSKYPALLIHVSKNLSLPISQQMLAELGKYFNLVNYKKIDFYQVVEKNILAKLQLPENKKLVLFNLYCDASSYLLTKQKYQLLLDFVSKYSVDNSYLVVLVGSLQDKNNDTRVYKFNHIDLRGKTSVIDIFSLVANNNSFCYVGFDSFVMHVFSVYEKPSFVLFRGRITRKQSNMLKQFHTRLFSSDKWVTLLD